MFRLLLFSFLFLSPGFTWALRPMVHYHDLVAGSGDRGYRDGSFARAQFNRPQGLAINDDASLLFVADQDNNRIRVVYLNENNRVETLAGTGVAGMKNGSFSEAQFNRPVALAYLPGDKLVIVDNGNFMLRLLDLKTQMVSTLAGTGSQGMQEGPALKTTLDTIWNLVYMPSENRLYFSVPDGCLQRLDLATGLIQKVLCGDPQISHPGPLCLYKGKLCLSDFQNNSIYLLDSTSNTSVVSKIEELSAPNTLLSGKNNLAMASWGDYLYVMRQNTIPGWIRIRPDDNFKFMSVWGYPIEENHENRELMLYFNDDHVGFIPDPKEERKFYVTSDQIDGVLSLKDYDFHQLRDLHDFSQQGLNDYNYPTQKPHHTFRILVVGDSLSFSTTFEEQNHWGWGFNRMENMPKRLELWLNTEAALSDNPLNYEVMDIGHGSEGYPSFLWPFYEVPQIVKKFDIDLVLYVFAPVPTQGYDCYFSCPITSNGIPKWPFDPSYLLKPWAERIPSGIPKDFYLRCLDKHWVNINNGQFNFYRFDTTIADEGIRGDLLEMMGKPIRLFHDELKDIKTSEGKPVQTQMLLIYSKSYGVGSGNLETFRTFWKTVADQGHWPYLDLIDDFIALGPTYFPTEEAGSWRHYTANGTLMYAYIMAHELISKGVIPFNIGTRSAVSP